MKSSKPLLICVVGATAIGKTALGIALAKAFSTEIISADSRQFYKEMAIGTAVPSEEELQAVPHHFIQHISIFEDYSVGDFERDALNKLKEIFKKNSTALLVGGSGLYVDALAKGLDTFPVVSKSIRENLNNELTEKGIKILQEELKTVDPDYFEKVDIQNPHRLIRALEIFRATGKPYSSFLQNKTAQRDFNILYIGLTAGRETIYERINLRVDKMVENGLIAEAKKLFRHKDKNALQTVGYRELFAYFKSAISRQEALLEIKKNTRRFAKRQNTWFKKNEMIHWFDYQTDAQEIIEFINKKNAV